MRDRSWGEPSDYVIWVAWGLLALISGLAGAFVLWIALHRAESVGLVDGAVGSLGTGLLLVGIAAKPLPRLVLVVAGATLLVAFFTGGTAFGKLIG